MAITPSSPALSFDSMSEKDKTIKLLKRQQIETHWACDIQQSIPESIRPRLLKTKKSKAKIGSSAAEAPWWRWSCKLLYKLENLADVTAGRHEYASHMMGAEVQQRQRDLTSHNKDVVEVLPADLTKLVAELRTIQYSAEERDDDDTSEEDEDEGDVKIEGSLRARYGDIVEDEAPSIERRDSHVKDEMVDEDENYGRGDYNAAPLQLYTPKKETLTTQAKIANLRAAAMRLRQEAAKREADAYQLEADMHQAEARKIQ